MSKTFELVKINFAKLFPNSFQTLFSRKLKSLLSHFESAADNFMNNIESQRASTGSNVFEIRKMCKCFAVDCISRYMFAVDIDSFKQQDSEFVKLAMRVGDVKVRDLILLELVPKFLQPLLNLNIFDVEPLDKLGDLFKRMLRERDPTLRFNDLSEMLQEQIRDGKLKNMTEDEIVANCLLGFFAGTDTTSNALAKVFYFLVTEPEVRQRLTEELRRDFKDGISYEQLVEHPYLDAFVNECLRLGQSLLTLDRLVTKDTQLGEYKLEKGVVVHMISYLNHVNENYWPNPEKFDVNRFLDKSSSNPNQIHRGEIYSPFSTGSRWVVLLLREILLKILLDFLILN